MKPAFRCSAATWPLHGALSLNYVSSQRDGAGGLDERIVRTGPKADAQEDDQP